MLALVPAHNEADCIASSVQSVKRQVDDVLVVCDNCTDDTESLAAAEGARTLATRGNFAKKAGALNQALANELSRLRDSDYVLVMDADSELDEGFVDAACRYLDKDLFLGGVSGTFRGGPGGGFVGMCQRNEYARYARDVRRLKGRALVLTGTAAVFRVRALRDILIGRQAGTLPYGGGHVYDEYVLTEDNELTLALLHLGWKILAPRECTLVTEIMPTWATLARQRLRWKRGALENIKDYGMTKVTASYWGRQALSFVGILATLVYLLSIATSVVAGSLVLAPFWVAVSTIFVLERTITVRDRGWKQQLLAASVIIEMVFDVFLQCVQACAFAQAMVNAERKW